MLNCKKTTELVSKKMDQKLSFRERISLKIHLLICGACAIFETETELIEKSMKNDLKNCPEMSVEKKENLQKLINSKHI